ncbi:MAG: DUF202 domain-containing protein [Vibrio sp.]
MNDSTLNKRDRDQGLQPQRTILSWFRTIAVIFLNSLLLIKVGMKTNSFLLLCLGSAILVLATLMYAYSIRRNIRFSYDVEIVTTKSIRANQWISLVLFSIGLLLSGHFFLQLI